MPNTDNMHSLQMVSYYFKYAYKVPDYYSTDTQQRTLKSKCPCHPQLTVSPELNVYLATPHTLTDRQHSQEKLSLCALNVIVPMIKILFKSFT